MAALHPSIDRNQRRRLNNDNKIRYQWSNRTEPCYTGNIHEERDITCEVSASNDVYAKCFSDHCKGPPHFLGSLEQDATTWEANAVWTKHQWTSAILTDKSCEKTLTRFNSGETQCLSVKAPLGSGKTTLLFEMLSKLPQETKILIISYRQSLSYELSGSKLKALNFTNYLDVKTDLDDRDKHPRVIIQIDSIDKLTSRKWSVPDFQYVIIDEVESVLLHLSAKTLKEPVFIITKFLLLLKGNQNGKRPQIITLDALWGENVYNFFKLNNISQEIIVNDIPPAQRKHFVLRNCDVSI